MKKLVQIIYKYWKSTFIRLLPLPSRPLCKAGSLIAENGLRQQGMVQFFARTRRMKNTLICE